eukprot:7380572-Prymnesium_polylepis.2
MSRCLAAVRGPGRVGGDRAQTAQPARGLLSAPLYVTAERKNTAANSWVTRCVVAVAQFHQHSTQQASGIRCPAPYGDVRRAYCGVRAGQRLCIWASGLRLSIRNTGRGGSSIVILLPRTSRGLQTEPHAALTRLGLLFSFAPRARSATRTVPLAASAKNTISNFKRARRARAPRDPPQTIRATARPMTRKNDPNRSHQPHPIDQIDAPDNP